MAKMKKVRIGSRARRLALLQAEEVAQRLRQAHNLGTEDVVIIPISTKGDQIRESPLWDMGGKGLFTERIEAGLLEGALDVAVHSMKDMPTRATPGLRADVMLKREDARDVLIRAPSANGVAAFLPVGSSALAPHEGRVKGDSPPSGHEGLRALPPGCCLGSSAPRRMAQILWLRPDVRVIPVRGNVETRLEKLASNALDAILLARAGLQRLGIAPDSSVTLSTEEMLPAAGQGVIVAQYREEDQSTQEMLAPMHHRETGLCIAAEKAFLEALNGSCTTPAGAFAEMQNEGELEGGSPPSRANKRRLVFTGRLLTMDGGEMREVCEQGDGNLDLRAAIAIGRRAGKALLRQKPRHRLAPGRRCVQSSSPGPQT